MSNNTNYHNFYPLNIFDLLKFVLSKYLFFLFFFIFYFFFSLIIYNNFYDRVKHIGYIKVLAFDDANVLKTIGKKEDNLIYFEYSRILSTNSMLELQLPNKTYNYLVDKKHLMHEDNLYRLYLKELNLNIKSDKTFNNTNIIFNLIEEDNVSTLSGTFIDFTIDESIKIYEQLFSLTNESSKKALINTYNKYIDNLILKIDDYIQIAISENFFKYWNI